MTRTNRVGSSIRGKIMDSFSKGNNLFKGEEILLESKMYNQKKCYRPTIGLVLQSIKNHKGLQVKVKE